MADRNIFDDFKSFARSKNWRIIHIPHNSGNYSVIYENDDPGVYGPRNQKLFIDYFLVTIYDDSGYIYTDEQREGLRNAYSSPEIKFPPIEVEPSLFCRVIGAAIGAITRALFKKK